MNQADGGREAVLKRGHILALWHTDIYASVRRVQSADESECMG
jgi:hypothetical protein